MGPTDLEEKSVCEPYRALSSQATLGPCQQGGCVSLHQGVQSVCALQCSAAIQGPVQPHRGPAVQRCSTACKVLGLKLGLQMGPEMTGPCYNPDCLASGRADHPDHITLAHRPCHYTCSSPLPLHLLLAPGITPAPRPCHYTCSSPLELHLPLVSSTPLCPSTGHSQGFPEFATTTAQLVTQSAGRNVTAHVSSLQLAPAGVLSA